MSGGVGSIGITNSVQQFIRARSFDEALAVRAEHGADCFPLVGGTDLLVMIRAGRWAPRVILDLSRIPGFAGIREEGADLVFMAGTTARDCLDSAVVRTRFPGLFKACAWLGGPPIQNAGSLGGNIATSSPAGDTVPCLVAVEARAVLRSTRGSRTVAVEDIPVRPGKSCLEPDELIEEIRVPLANIEADPRGFAPGAIEVPKLHTVIARPPLKNAPARWTTNDFLKAGPRLAQVISIVSMAAWAEMIGPRTVKRLRLAYGCAGPKVMLGRSASALLEGREITPELAEEAARAIQQDISPISDVRGSKDYKRLLCANYTRLFLQDLGGFPLGGTRPAAETLAGVK